MATIVRQIFTAADIADFAQFISGMGFSDTDFSVEGVYDFIVNSKTKLRLRLDGGKLALFVVFNDAEVGNALSSGSTLNTRLLTTGSGSVLSMIASTIDVNPTNASNIILCTAKSTYDKSTDDVLITTTGSTSGTKIYAPDMATSANSAETVNAPITNSLNTVIYKYAHSASYYIPNGLYGIRNTNVNLLSGYYRLTLNDLDYETIGYVALKD